jgi:hypothetical protein
MRLRIEALRARLEGRSGLRRHAERLHAQGHSPAQETEAPASRLSPQRLTGVFSYLESLSQYVPDREIGSSLRNRLHLLTRRMRGQGDG